MNAIAADDARDLRVYEVREHKGDVQVRKGDVQVRSATLHLAKAHGARAFNHTPWPEMWTQGQVATTHGVRVDAAVIDDARDLRETSCSKGR